MFSNVLGYSLFFGISTALDTLAAQAVTGASNPRQAGIYLQRAILINFALAVPLSAAWCFAEPLLLLVGQDPELSSMAGDYIRILAFGILPMTVSDCIDKFLLAQDITHVQLLVCMITVPFNAGIGYWLTFETSWIGLLLTAFYMFHVDGYRRWNPWSAEVLRGWGSYIALGIPGLLMLCADWWCFELIAISAGTLGPIPLAAQAIILNISSTIIVAFSGLAMVTVAIAMCVVASLVTASLLFVFRYRLPLAFTTDPELIAMVASVLPIVALFHVTDAGVCIMNRVFRGCGKQNVGAAFTMSSYYLIAVPLGLLLTFVAGAGLHGSWWGLAVGLATCFCGELLYLTRYVDWRAEVVATKARVDGTACDERSLYARIPQAINIFK
ncbi:ethionine resistance protein [Blastocladiella emersonii ATCC 22665]|nr:ethionine resistance protein [Blastocladiella emersonii ATCC 22665]